MVTSQFGEIDFSADYVGIEIIKGLYENSFPYLEITEKGKTVIYGIEPVCNTESKLDKPISTKKTKVISNTA